MVKNSGLHSVHHKTASDHHAPLRQIHITTRSGRAARCHCTPQLSSPSARIAASLPSLLNGRRPSAALTTRPQRSRPLFPLPVHWVSLSARAVPHNPRRALPQPLRCKYLHLCPVVVPIAPSSSPRLRRFQKAPSACAEAHWPPSSSKHPTKTSSRRAVSHIDNPEPPARYRPAVIRLRPVAAS